MNLLTVAKSVLGQRGVNEQKREVNEQKCRVNEEILYQTKRENKGSLDFLTWGFGGSVLQESRSVPLSCLIVESCPPVTSLSKRPASYPVIVCFIVD